MDILIKTGVFMFNRLILSSMLLSGALYGVNLAAVKAESSNQQVRSPAELAKDLDSIEIDFQLAKEMFIPWYTGPLITGGAINMPMGKVNLQPYVYFTVNHAAYDGNRHSVNIPNMYVINPLMSISAGITHWLDVGVSSQGYFAWQDGHSGQALGDIPINFGFQIYKETPYIPNFRIIIGEKFPVGAYNELDPKKYGLDIGGGGVYVTQIGLNISKVFWAVPLHPMSLRLATLYTQPNGKAHVKGLNTYGGASDTDGKVTVGTSFSADLGFEVSLNQQWVVATDIAYTASAKSTFNGYTGLNATGDPAVVGFPSSDQLSLSPSIEYNINSSSGLFGVLWFSVTGRNSFNFASLVMSYTKTF